MRISDWSSDVCSSDLFGDLDSDRWNVWGALSVKENRILRGVDRDFANSFQPDRGLSPDTRGPPFATVFNQNGAIIVGSLVDPRSEERRVGKEWGRQGRSGGVRYHRKKNKRKKN